MKQTVMIVDDSNIIQNLVEKALENKFTVVKASNGKEALSLIKVNEGKIDCILLDLNMPEFDGFMVLEYFQEHKLFNQIPVSIISGDDTKDTIEKAFKYDIVDMLTKPLSQKSIKNVVEKTISIKSLMKR